MGAPRSSDAVQPEMRARLAFVGRQNTTGLEEFANILCPGNILYPGAKGGISKSGRAGIAPVGLRCGMAGRAGWIIPNQLDPVVPTSFLFHSQGSIYTRTVFVYIGIQANRDPNRSLYVRLLDSVTNAICHRSSILKFWNRDLKEKETLVQYTSWNSPASTNDAMN